MGLRQEKFSRQIQKDLGEIFLQHKDWVGGQFVTISHVLISPDLSIAKVYLSMFNTRQRAAVLDSLELNQREVRMALAQRVKNQVKKVPELRFFEDDSLDYAQKMDKLFEDMKKNGDNKD